VAPARTRACSRSTRRSKERREVKHGGTATNVFYRAPVISSAQIAAQGSLGDRDAVSAKSTIHREAMTGASISWKAMIRAWLFCPRLRSGPRENKPATKGTRFGAKCQRPGGRPWRRARPMQPADDLVPPHVDVIAQPAVPRTRASHTGPVCVRCSPRFA